MSRRLAILPVILAAVLTMVSSLASAQPYGGYPDRERNQFAPTGQDLSQREDRQRARIEMGIRRGQITRREAFDLLRRQARIHHQIQIARSDGYVDRRERDRIVFALNRQDQRIFRERRDGDANRWPANYR